LSEQVKKQGNRLLVVDKRVARRKFRKAYSRLEKAVYQVSILKSELKRCHADRDVLGLFVVAKRSCVVVDFLLDCIKSDLFDLDSYLTKKTKDMLENDYAKIKRD